MANLKLLLVLSIIVAVAVGESGKIPPQPGNISTEKTSSPTTTIPTTTTNSTTSTSSPTKSSSTTPITKPTTPNVTTVNPSTPTSHPNTTTAAPNTSTPSSNVTTVAPTTSTPASNTTTVSPTTHAPTPKTTTVAPTTPSIAPNTTTVAPTTPAPTPKPAPVPEPQTGNWSVDFTKTNNSCMVMDAAIQIEILSQNSSQKINIPANATARGSCSNDSDVLSLNWDKHTIEFDFDRKVNDSKFELELVKATLVNLTLPDVGVKNYTLVHKTSEFGTPLGNSYKCMKVQSLNLTEEGKDNVTVAILHISHVQLQAFTNVTDHKFSSAIDCEASAMTSDVVPIVVGCVLAALVIMITVAYLVARRRCQSRGYLSM